MEKQNTRTHRNDDEVIEKIRDALKKIFFVSWAVSVDADCCGFGDGFRKRNPRLR